MKKNGIISVVLFITFLIIIINAFNFYYDWYRSNTDKENIAMLKNIFLVYGYDTSLAENLVEGKRTGYQSINITALENNSVQTFTYYTIDSVKVDYTVSFWTTPEFFKYNLNTQMNILTNIHKVCKYHFQNEYKLDSIYYKSNETGYYIKNNKKFIVALINCIKKHINDKNNIKDIQEVNSHLFKYKSEDSFSFAAISELGNLCLDTDNFNCKKIKDGLKKLYKGKNIEIPFSKTTKLTAINFDI